jgi:serine/threonine protein kinase
MAPEVIAATGHNTKADIWSFGITMLELFDGAPPRAGLAVADAMLAIQRGEPPRAPAGASAVFSEFIEKVLVKDPGGRPAAEELLREPFVRMSEGQRKRVITDALRESRLKMEESHSAGDLTRLLPPSEIEGPPIEEAPTIVYGDGTTVLHDDTEKDQADAADPLAAWTLVFLENPTVSAVASQKRNFANFSCGDLKYILESFKKLALSELDEGKDRAAVLAHYNEVRDGIVAELRRKDAAIPADIGLIA